MATVKDLYTQEGAKLSKVETTLTASLASGQVKVLGSTFWHYELAAFYRAYYVDVPPPSELVGLLISFIGAPRFHEGLKITDGHPAQFGELTNEYMTESPCTVIYVNGRMDPSDIAQVQAVYASHRKTVIIRDVNFADYVTTHSSPAAFISHDSRDKDDFARPLAERLAAQLVPVWYDEYSMKVGDNIYESLEKGLKLASKVIVLLSKNFFSNSSWARQEFLMAIHRHITRRVLLPVWIDVDVEEVKRYDLTLASLLALRWPLGFDRLQAATQVAQRLADAIKAQRSQ